MPKSGTYLCANLLSEFKIQNTSLHLGQHQYQKYNLENLEDCQKNPKNYTIKSSLADSINLIFENSYAVGHIPFSIENENLLRGFKKVLLIRDHADIIESTARWKELSNREVKNYKLTKINRIKEWIDRSEVYVLDFNDMINQNLIRLDQLQFFLFSEVLYDSKICIKNALKSPSLTKSNIR